MTFFMSSFTCSILISIDVLIISVMSGPFKACKKVSVGRLGMDSVLSKVSTELGELLERLEVDGRLLVQPLILRLDQLRLRLCTSMKRPDNNLKCHHVHAIGLELLDEDMNRASGVGTWIQWHPVVHSIARVGPDATPRW